ncbi:MAG: ABC transporter permease [Deltaproteobacteria bacterium]|nr:ABC transporter permease [Deltaproteobacteria bacterium]
MKIDFDLLLGQLRNIWVIARKDIRIYYSKGPVVIFGILFPAFLFLSFIIGRHLSIEYVLPGLLGMILFFTATAISPAVVPWEAQARTLERLMSCPVKIYTIIFGDLLASFIFGIIISIIPILIGLVLGVSIFRPFILSMGIILAGLSFSALGLLFSAAPTTLPSTTMMLSSLIKFPVVFISGIFIPLHELPAWGRAVAYISPLTYFTDIARHSIQNRGHLPIALDFAVLLAFIALFLTLDARLHMRTMPKRI